MKLPLLLFLLPWVSFGQVTNANIEQVLTERLNEAVPASFTSQQSSTLWEKDLTTLSWKILPETVVITIEKENYAEEPVSELSQVYQNVNCSESPRSWTETFSLSVNKFSSIHYSQTVSSSTSENTSVDLKFAVNFGILSPGFHHGKTKQMLEQISLVNQEGKTHQETQTTQRSLEVKAGPRETLTITATQQVYTLKIPFTISFQVDGTVSYQHELTASTLHGVTFEEYIISEVLSSEERTFTVSGYLTENETSKLKIHFDTQPIEKEDCMN
jgi:hypothetical protein